MPITHPALPSGPELWKYSLACGHWHTGLRLDNPYGPVLCHHTAHGPDDGSGFMTSIVRMERAG